MTATSRRLFSDVTALRTIADGHFTGEVDEGWTIRGKPNGGYLLAMLGRAAAATTEHRHVIAASAHYVRAPEPGRVSIQTELLRAGRSASQVRATLSQDDRTCIAALLTTSLLDRAARPFWDHGLPQVSTVPYEDGIPLAGLTPDGTEVAMMDQIEVRLEPESASFTTGAPRGRGELRGWLELPEGETFDPISLLFAVDAFPPATVDIAYSGWVPTLELTAYVRALPAPGPVRVLQRAHLIDGQRIDEVCFVWDAAGRLVAQGTQLAGVRLG
jgi:hypothetical protein